MGGKHLPPPEARLRFYLTPEHPCGYLEGQGAATLLADPQAPMDPWLYDRLLRQGFRRSGAHVYRPHCTTCGQCLSVRLPVNRFQPNRTQRRVWKRNQDLRVSWTPPVFQEELFALYHRYLGERHRGGPMENPTPEGFLDFLACPWMETRFVRFRDPEGTLLMVAVVDLLPNGLSAVYTFFDPEASRQRSLGTYAILWQMAMVRRGGGQYLYLGYWVPDSPKMRYKAAFQPQELYRLNHWHPFAALPPDQPPPITARLPLPTLDLPSGNL